MSKKLNLYVWTGFCSGFTDGIAVAVAESIEQAQQLVTAEKGYEPWEWGRLQVFELTAPVACCVSGGG
jgi:hypothetical protein